MEEEEWFSTEIILLTKNRVTITIVCFRWGKKKEGPILLPSRRNACKHFAKAI